MLNCFKIEEETGSFDSTAFVTQTPRVRVMGLSEYYEKCATSSYRVSTGAPRIDDLRRTRNSRGSGSFIRAYTDKLAEDETTFFSQAVGNFISCTRKSEETQPKVVMRNIRQFMNGMKNNLVTNDKDFTSQVEKERKELRGNLLNVDVTLEGVMHKHVVRPLKEHIFKLFLDEYSDSGAIQLLAKNIKYARTKEPKDIGIRPSVILPSKEMMSEICSYLRKMQDVDSPLEKLENLLTSIASLFHSVKMSSPNGDMMLGADDFLPLFVWVLVQSGMVEAEIEADYMWGLLETSLLFGEAGYYLTTLSSAVHILKNFRDCSEETTSSANLNWGKNTSSTADSSSFLKIVVPDEMNGSIITKTLLIPPDMTTKDVCNIIADKVKIINPQDYSLYTLIDGEETVLADSECPQSIKGTLSTTGKHCMFAYKRIDAKRVCPKNTLQ